MRVTLDDLIKDGFKMAQLVQVGAIPYTNCYVKLRNMGFPVLELNYVADGVVMKHITVVSREMSVIWEV